MRNLAPPHASARLCASVGAGCEVAARHHRHRRGADCSLAISAVQLERIAIQFLFDAADDDSKTGLKDAERSAHKKIRALMG